MKITLEFQMPDDLAKLQAATNAEKAIAALLSIKNMVRALRAHEAMSPDTFARRINEIATDALEELGHQ